LKKNDQGVFVDKNGVALQTDLELDANGNPVLTHIPQNAFVDRRGTEVTTRGYRLDKDGNIIDNQGRKKFDKSQLTPDGDLPKLFNYNGRRFDITDVIGSVDKDRNGDLAPMTNSKGQLVDNAGRRINSRGYLTDEFGNVIDKDGR